MTNKERLKILNICQSIVTLRKHLEYFAAVHGDDQREACFDDMYKLTTTMLKESQPMLEDIQRWALTRKSELPKNARWE